MNGSIKNIQNAIINYIENSEDPYALEINGEWGTGKTYFVKNTLFPILKDNGKTPIYISLNGISSIKSFNLKLLNAMLCSQIGKRKTKLTYSILNLTGSAVHLFENSNKFGKILKDLNINNKSVINKVINGFLHNNSKKNKNVLFIDDLERSKFSNFQEIMGAISTIIDKFKCKVIIITNEEAYKNKKINKEFRTIKEKVISKTIRFGYDTQSIAISILKKRIYNNRYLHKGWIFNVSKSLLSCLKCINLRTINSIIYTYDEFFRFIQNTKFSYKSKAQALKTGYLSIFMITDALKRNELKLPELKNLYNKNFLNIKLEINILESSLKHKNLKRKNYNNFYLYCVFLNNKNINNLKIYSNVMFDKEIVKLIISNEFNSTKFMKHINKCFHSNDRNSSYLELLRHYELMSDDTIKSYEEKWNKSFDIQNTPLSALINEYSFLHFLNINNLLLCDGFNLPKIKKFILYKAKKIPLSKLDILAVSFDFQNTNKDLDTSLKNIYKNKKEQLPLYNDKNELIKILHGNIFQASGIFFNSNSIFHLILSNNKLQIDIMNKPKYIIYLKYYLQDNIIKMDDSYKFHSIELKYIDSFIEFLIKNISNDDNQAIIRFNLKNLLYVVKRCKNTLLAQKDSKQTRL